MMPDRSKAARELLNFYAEAGVDAAIGEQANDFLSAPEPPPVVAPVALIVIRVFRYQIADPSPGPTNGVRSLTLFTVAILSVLLNYIAVHCIHKCALITEPYTNDTMSDLSRARLSSTDGVAAGRRPGQRRRTRAAILAAAVTLLAAGGTPSMAEVAEAADVSRRTMYQYFPTLDQLLTEAALEAVRSAVGQAVEPTEHPEDVEARLDALVRATQRSTITNESLMRTMIRLTVERPPDTESESLPRRGYSRIEWIEVALQPLRKRLNKPRYERLVSALALCIGIEALLVLRDIRGLSASQAEDVSVWAAQSLLQAALEEMS